VVATVVVVIVEGTYESVWTIFPLWSRTNAVSPSLFQIAPPVAPVERRLVGGSASRVHGDGGSRSQEV
jgi:hypothetical protein